MICLINPFFFLILIYDASDDNFGIWPHRAVFSDSHWQSFQCPYKSRSLWSDKWCTTFRTCLFWSAPSTLQLPWQTPFLFLIKWNFSNENKIKKIQIINILQNTWHILVFQFSHVCLLCSLLLNLWNDSWKNKIKLMLVKSFLIYKTKHTMNSSHFSLAVLSNETNGWCINCLLLWLTKTR